MNKCFYQDNYSYFFMVSPWCTACLSNSISYCCSVLPDSSTRTSKHAKSISMIYYLSKYILFLLLHVLSMKVHALCVCIIICGRNTEDRASKGYWSE